MRTLLFILIFGTLHAQDSLPGNNAKIIQFVNDNYGEKVGSGICVELVEWAVKTTNPEWSIEMPVNEYEIAYDKIMPGDIIQFDSAYFENGEVIESHIAIVYRVGANGLITIAEQNVPTQENNQETVMYRNKPVLVEKDSHVKFYLFDMNKASGKIYFYRM